MSHAQKDSNVCGQIMSAWASSPMWRVCMQDNVCVAREGVSSGRVINHRFQFWAWTLIFCYRSSVFLRVNANACTLRTVPWRWRRGRPASCAAISGFSTAAPIRIEGKMEKEIERQVGIIMELFWDGVVLMEIEGAEYRRESKGGQIKLSFQI